MDSFSLETVSQGCVFPAYLHDDILFYCNFVILLSSIIDKITCLDQDKRLEVSILICLIAVYIYICKSKTGKNVKRLKKFLYKNHSNL